MDFMHDTLADGRLVRVLTLIDSYTRESLALVAQARFRGEAVARVLQDVGAQRALPRWITVDNGTEFTSRALDAWAYWNHVQLDFSRPGKPGDNCLIEAFNGSLRRECLSQHWFASIAEAQQILDGWRVDYNTERPHRSLANRSPAEHHGGGRFIPSPNRLLSCTSQWSPWSERRGALHPCARDVANQAQRAAKPPYTAGWLWVNIPARARWS